MRLNIYQILFILLIAIGTLIFIAGLTYLLIVTQTPDVTIQQFNANQCVTEIVGNCSLTQPLR